MYGPDSYIFETNLALLATLADEDLADPALVAELAPGTAALAELSGWLFTSLARGLTALGEWFAPPAGAPESSGDYWMYPP